MKVKTKPLVIVVMSVIVASVLSIISARVFWGYDIFDRSGWSTTKDGTICYLDYYGDPVLGWQEIEGETYYFSPEEEGSLVTGWLDVPEGTYYLNEDGLKTTGWFEWDSKRYYFDPDGKMHVGWLDTEDGRYFLSDDGHMQTGWMETEKGLCYLSESGAIVTGWVDTEQGRYYLNEDGIIHTGWLELDDNTYFLSEDGILYTGWMDIEDTRYYFKEDGSMAVGKTMIDGATRYFTSNGKYFVLVNRWNKVPDDYESNLVWVGGVQVDASCQDALLEMIAACEASGNLCNLTSGYRGYDYQNKLFQKKVTKLMGQGYTRAAAENETSRSIAIPGTSEHQLGLAVDIKSGANTYNWLAQNSWKYGFILRYPNGTTSLTGIYYEPWHFRYVGKELAKEIYELDLCLEEYISTITKEAE